MNERMRDLADEVYDFVFALFDAEIDIEGYEAGFIATAAQKAVIKAIAERDDWPSGSPKTR